MVSFADMTSTVAERLCGSMPMTTRSDVELTGVLRCSIQLLVVEPGGQRCFEPHKPLLSLSWPLATPGPRRPNESHTTSVGSRNESDEPSAWTKPRQDRSYRQLNKQPRSGRSPGRCRDGEQLEAVRSANDTSV